MDRFSFSVFMVSSELVIDWLCWMSVCMCVSSLGSRKGLIM